MMKRIIIAFIVLCSFQAQAAFNVGDFIGGLFSDDEEYIETTQKITFDDGSTVKDSMENSLTLIAFFKSNADYLYKNFDAKEIEALQQQFIVVCSRYSCNFTTSKKMQEISKEVVEQYNLQQPSCISSKWEIEGNKKNGKIIKVTCSASPDVYALVDTEEDGDYISTSEDDFTFKVGNRDFENYVKSDPMMIEFLRELYGSLE